MSGFSLALLWLFTIIAIVRIHTALWRRLFTERRFGDQVHFIATEDSWQLAIHHYVSAERKYKEPVVLCHGYGANRYNFDLTDDRSLARELSNQGFDVWVIELRGAGLSRKSDWSVPLGWAIDFDDYLTLDLPPVMEHIREATGEKQIYWVGHSMGGMLGYAWLGTRRDHGLKGLVTVCSPVNLSESKVFRQSGLLLRLCSLGGVIPQRALAHFFSPLFGGPVRIVSRLIIHKDGMEGSLVRKCMVNLIENATGAMTRQARKWMSAGTLTSRDGTEDYLAALEQAQEPVLILGADADRLAPPTAVEPAYQKIGSGDKRLRIFGIDRGDEHDFGHGDILLGKYAREVVFPEITEWLKSRATSL